MWITVSWNNYNLFLEGIDYSILNNPNELKDSQIYMDLNEQYDSFFQQITKDNDLFQSIVE